MTTTVAVMRKESQVPSNNLSRINVDHLTQFVRNVQSEAASHENKRTKDFRSGPTRRVAVDRLKFGSRTEHKWQRPKTPRNLSQHNGSMGTVLTSSARRSSTQVFEDEINVDGSFHDGAPAQGKITKIPVKSGHCMI